MIDPRRLLATSVAFFIAALLFAMPIFAGPLVEHYQFNVKGATPNNGSGQELTVTTASPPMVQVYAGDSGTEPFFLPQAADTTVVGVHGLAGTTARTSLVDRGTFETCSAGNFSGWIESTPAGNGTSAITCETGTMADGAMCAKLALTGTTSVAQVTSTCITTGVGADLMIQLSLKGTGTGAAQLFVLQYATAACGTSVKTDTLFTGLDVPADWTRYSELQAAANWDGATNSYRLRLRETGNGGVNTYLDSFEAFAGSEPRPGSCCSDTSAPTVCTASIPQDHSPISADGSLTIRAKMQSPWAGTELVANKHILYDGTAGNANSILFAVLSTTDEPYLAVYDSTPATLAITSSVANWAADTEYDIEWYRAPDATKVLGLHWNSAWNTTTAGAGTGHRAAAADYLHFGGDCWIKDLRIYKAVLR